MSSSRHQQQCTLPAQLCGWEQARDGRIFLHLLFLCLCAPCAQAPALLRTSLRLFFCCLFCIVFFCFFNFPPTLLFWHLDTPPAAGRGEERSGAEAHCLWRSATVRCPVTDRAPRSTRRTARLRRGSDSCSSGGGSSDRAPEGREPRRNPFFFTDRSRRIYRAQSIFDCRFFFCKYISTYIVFASPKSLSSRATSPSAR